MYRGFFNNMTSEHVQAFTASDIQREMGLRRDDMVLTLFRLLFMCCGRKPNHILMKLYYVFRYFLRYSSEAITRRVSVVLVLSMRWKLSQHFPVLMGHEKCVRSDV